MLKKTYRRINSMTKCSVQQSCWCTLDQTSDLIGFTNENIYTVEA